MPKPPSLSSTSRHHEKLKSGCVANVTSAKVPCAQPRQDHSIDWKDFTLPFGTKLSKEHLDAKVTTLDDGAVGLSYSPDVGHTPPSVGNVIVTVTAAATAKKYNKTQKRVTLTVIRVDQEIHVRGPHVVQYGHHVTIESFGATCSSKQTVSVHEADQMNRVLDCGTYTFTLQAPETPNYNAASKTVTVEVTPVENTISWAPPPGLVYGVKFKDLPAPSALEAPHVRVSIANEKPLAAQRHTVTFTAEATRNYKQTVKEFSFAVEPAEQTIEWTPVLPVVAYTPYNRMSSPKINGVGGELTGAKWSVQVVPSDDSRQFLSGEYVVTFTAEAVPNYKKTVKEFKLNVEKYRPSITRFAAPPPIYPGLRLTSRHRNPSLLTLKHPEPLLATCMWSPPRFSADGPYDLSVTVNETSHCFECSATTTITVLPCPTVRKWMRYLGFTEERNLFMMDAGDYNGTPMHLSSFKKIINESTGLQPQHEVSFTFDKSADNIYAALFPLGKDNEGFHITLEVNGRNGLNNPHYFQHGKFHPGNCGNLTPAEFKKMRPRA